VEQPPAPPLVLDAERRHRNWREVLFAPRGGGGRRRRGSDVFKLIAALLLVMVGLAALHTGLRLDHVLAMLGVPLPLGLQWVLTSLWLIGTVGAIALVVGLALLARGFEVLRDLALAAAIALAASYGLRVLFGATAGRPSNSQLSGVNPDFPVIAFVVAVACLLAANPYFARGIQRSFRVLVGVTAVVALLRGSGMPIAIFGSIVIAWGAVAIVHLAVGSPLGLPSVDDVQRLLTSVGFAVADLEPYPNQSWGAVRYEGREQDRTVAVVVYGRDAADAMLVSKLARSAFLRDSGPGLSVTRLQQVEHEAFLTLMAGRVLGSQVSEVLTAGEASRGDDALLVLAPPVGTRLIDRASTDPLSEAEADAVFATVARLGQAGLTHGSLSLETVLLNEHGVAGLREFAEATIGAPAERIGRDRAAALVVVALRSSVQRAVASAGRVLGAEGLASVLPFLQKAALPTTLARQLRGQGGLLKELRAAGAAQAGVAPPELYEPRRVSWPTLIIAVGTLIGGWALIGVLLKVADSFSTLKTASIPWVVLTFLLAISTTPAVAVTTVGSVTKPLPFGRVALLELSDSFTGLAAGSVGVLGARVRFIQRQGYDATLAISSGVVASTASWIVKGALFLLCLPIAWGSFDFGSSLDAGTTGAKFIKLILVVVVVVGLVAGIAMLLPRWRRLAVAKLRPKLDESLDHLKVLSGTPSKLVEIFGGQLAAQLLVALALGTSLHAFGDHLSLPTIIVVITIGSMLGGISPVPGGMGVVEAGMILGLTAAGIQNDVAVSAVFLQRLFTSYLPPIWGWFALIYLRRREYL